MNNPLIAKASISINATIENVWDAFVNPKTIKQYMFGTTVISDWKVGHPIIWKGEWQGKTYEDKGIILQLKPRRLLQYSHFSPLTGLPDIPENYHIVTIELSAKKDTVLISLTQDNNPTRQALEDSKKNWDMMLVHLKKIIETPK